jgi:hypothetical protein
MTTRAAAAFNAPVSVQFPPQRHHHKSVMLAAVDPTGATLIGMYSIRWDTTGRCMYLDRNYRWHDWRALRSGVWWPAAAFEALRSLPPPVVEADGRQWRRLPDAPDSPRWVLVFSPRLDHTWIARFFDGSWQPHPSDMDQDARWCELPKWGLALPPPYAVASLPPVPVLGDPCSITHVPNLRCGSAVVLAATGARGLEMIGPHPVMLATHGVAYRTQNGGYVAWDSLRSGVWWYEKTFDELAITPRPWPGSDDVEWHTMDVVPESDGWLLVKEPDGNALMGRWRGGVWFPWGTMLGPNPEARWCYPPSSWYEAWREASRSGS